jgi:DNA polymerase I
MDSTYTISPVAGAGVSLGGGGFTPDTFVMTAEGATRVDAISPGTEVYALDPMTRLVKPKRLTAVQQIAFDGPLVTVETRRANFHVAPGHPMLYRTKNDQQPRFQRAGDLPDRHSYKFITNWQRPPREPLEAVDITELIDDYEISATFDEHGHTVRAMLPAGCEPTRCNSHTGYFFDPATFKQFQSLIETAAATVRIHSAPGHRHRPYRFEGDDFIRLIGWFVTEGSVYHKQNRNSAEIQIAQKTERHRDSIRTLFDRLEISVTEKPEGFVFGSLLYGRLLERLCGEDSHSKRLPHFVWTLPRRQQKLLLDVLVAGDGDEYGTYYTASERLASDVLRLCVDVGLNPRYRLRRGTWAIHPAKVNDGFQSPRHVASMPSNDSVCQLTVADYSAVLAGRKRKFQWVGVSNVS